MKRHVPLMLMAMAAGSCAPAIIDDGFRARLVRPCSTEGECAELLRAARDRRIDCDEPGHVSCASAEADYSLVSGTQDRIRSEVEQRRQTEATEHDRDASENTRRFVAEYDARERRAEEIRMNDQGHANAVSLCVNGGGLEACGDDDEACKRECATQRGAAEERIFNRAKGACVERFLDSNGKTRACVLPSSATAPIARQAECDKACVDVAIRKRRYFATHAKCCDNTRSPTCTYGDLRNGCCSHHDGVCAEDEPE